MRWRTMSSQRGLLGGIGDGPKRVAQAPILGQVILMHTTRLSDFCLQFLPGKAGKLGSHSLFGKRRQIQAFCPRASHEVAVEGHIDSTLSRLRIVEFHAHSKW